MTSRTILTTAMTLLCLMAGQVMAVGESVKQFCLSFSYKLTSTEPCSLLDIPGILHVGIIDGRLLSDGGKLDLTFPSSSSSSDSDTSFTWTLDLDQLRAQFSPDAHKQQPTLRDGGKPHAAVEIAGRRTMISFRHGLSPRRLVVQPHQKTIVKNMTFSPF